ncbi:MAG: serine protease [Elusimicrobia bacterium CG08_land_8_20_14_0_20_59_10]|nr:MAG: serine protease [Elusimicrobia bacterium CG08_land_8_20_14_0_20_59_10]
MKNLMKTTLSAAALVALPLLSFGQGKSIYGPDNRKDFYEIPAAQQTLSASVVSLWKSANVTADASGNYALTTSKFADAYGLCPAEKFREQPIGAFCSGSLVGEDIIMTAGHCIKTEADCKDTKLVFGFKIGKAGEAATTKLAKSEVYTCSKIIKRFLGGEPGSTNPAGQSLGPDYALIKLDRKVTGHKPLPVNRNQNLAKGTKMFVIGHPVGLPVKAAGGASVRDAGKIGYFVADLDTFGGNSGSPVFNESTNKIEGILVRGDRDFLRSPAGCVTMATYEQTGGRGEDVTKISSLSADIPKLAGEKETDLLMDREIHDMLYIAPADATYVAPARVSFQ